MIVTTKLPEDLAKSRSYLRPSLFEREYGVSSRNFMTPDLIGYWSVPGRCAVELSTGEGLTRGTTIYGVSVAYIPEPNRTARRGKCAHSLDDAIELLRRALRGEDIEQESTQ